MHLARTKQNLLDFWQISCTCLLYFGIDIARIGYIYIYINKCDPVDDEIVLFVKLYHN